MRVPMRPAAPAMTSLIPTPRERERLEGSRQLLAVIRTHRDERQTQVFAAQPQHAHRRFYRNGIGFEKERADDGKELKMKLARAIEMAVQRRAAELSGRPGKNIRHH